LIDLFAALNAQSCILNRKDTKIQYLD